MAQQVDAARIIARLQNELAGAITARVIAEERAEQAERAHAACDDQSSASDD